MRRATVALALTLAAAGCSREPAVPLGTLSPDQAVALINERDEARDRVAAVERQYQREIDELRAEVADLRGQLGMAQETAEEAADRAERFEAGLDRAVARLNEVSDEAANAQRLAAANRAAAIYAPAEAERSGAGDLSYFSAPKLSIVENSIVASGRFYNGGDAPARGILYLDLVRDGEVLDTAEQRIIANQKSWGSWQQQFHFTRRGNGQVSVVPRFEAE